MIIRDTDRVKIHISENYVDKIYKKDSTGSLTEINILSTIVHPNIIRLIELKKNIYGFVTIRMEKADANLSDWLVNGIKKNISDKINIIYQIINALDCIHRNNIVHLDLKPDNIMLSFANNKISVKLIDFDNARYMTDNKVFTDYIIGTVTHRAPESDDDGILTTASDIWSVGILIYEILSDTPIYLHPELPDCANYSLDEYEKIVKKYMSSEKFRYKLRQILPPELLQCFNSDSSKRPVLTDIIEIITETYNIKHIPTDVSFLQTYVSDVFMNTPSCEYYCKIIDKIIIRYPTESKYYPRDVKTATFNALAKLDELNELDIINDLTASELNCLIYMIHRMIPNAECIILSDIIDVKTPNTKIMTDIIIKLSGKIYVL